jgi:hypothetical protein
MSDDDSTKQKEPGYSSYDYETDEAFSRFVQGDESAEEEFRQLLNRDLDKRLREIEEDD